METFIGRWNIYLGRTLRCAPSFSKGTMKKILTYILVVIAVFAGSVREVKGQELSVSQSASIKTESYADSYDYRVETLRNFLNKYNSPLAPFARDLVSYADANGLDYRLVASISGVESTFGKNIPKNSFNAYGWNNGNHSFTSWQNSIKVVSTSLNTDYINNGASSLSKIAKRYAPPSSTWGWKVKYFQGKIDTLPLSFDL
jgi:hypothetical protein